MRTNPSDALSDDRGAIMVLGIFMCTCLVGALWYVAGVGDAILYRERLQEAADAVAFSDAAFHARGMNLLVLVNLIMACILGIRVALKAGKLVLGIAAAVFGGLGFLCPPFWAAVGPCLAGVQALDTAINSTRPVINESLSALTKASEVISSVTPAASRQLAMTTVGRKYGLVGRIGVEDLRGDDLPVDKGSQDKLCKEAGRSVGQIAGWMFRKAGLGFGGKPMEWLGDRLGDLASTSPQYFCELGSATGSPDTNGMFAESAQQRCQNEPKAEHGHFEDAEAAWKKKCAEYGVTCDSRDDKDMALDAGKQTGNTATPEQQAELDRLRLERDQAARSLKDLYGNFANGVVGPLDQGRCYQWAVADSKRNQGEQQAFTKSSTPDTSGGSSSDAYPRRVDSGFKNGRRDGQVVAVVAGDPSRIRRSARMVRVVGSNGHRADHGDPHAEVPSWAQAEMFFDCGGEWASCNDDEDAMWHLQWRARLRRFDDREPLDGILAGLGFQPAGIDGFTDATDRTSGLYQPSPDLRRELSDALHDRVNRTRGIH